LEGVQAPVEGEQGPGEAATYSLEGVQVPAETATLDEMCDKHIKSLIGRRTSTCRSSNIFLTVNDENIWIAVMKNLTQIELILAKKLLLPM